MTKRFSIFVLISIFLGLGTSLKAQEVWDLRRCVEYAWEHNLSIKLTDIQARIAELSYEQAKMGRYPNVNFSNSTGTNFGRAVDPTTNLFVSSTLLFQQYNLNVNGLIYNFGNVKNQVLASRISAQAASQDVQTNKNDIGLTVATTYLQVLLAKEQARIAYTTMQLTKARLADTRKRVDAGSLPELNALELESQFARDSATYISAATTAEQNLLNLKATLNLDAATPFDIAAPPVEMIPVENIADLLPEYVFQIAMQTQPQIKANDLRIQVIEYNLKAAKAALYPSINFFGGIGTNFANPNSKITGFNFLGYVPSQSVVNVNGTNQPVLDPNVQLIRGKKGFGEMWTGWGNQIDQNFRQNLGIQLSVPIFSGGIARTNYKRIQLNMKSASLTRDQAVVTLKNNVYLAYVSAKNALERYNASKRTLELTEKTFDLAQKRYNAGLMSTIDYITNQNNLFRARIQKTADQFDYVFRMKVLEFYKGMGLKL
ncbi:MAG: TolC family protein [Chitinophagaceae bacterium]|nr:TolC family protein [Chitinophagaceae bacterium]